VLVYAQVFQLLAYVVQVLVYAQVFQLLAYVAQVRAYAQAFQLPAYVAPQVLVYVWVFYSLVS
jgi:hypothetical protein